MHEVEIKIENTKTRRKLIFAFPRTGASMVLGIEGIALLNLYWKGYGVPAFYVTLAQAIGFIIIGFGQFILGWVSDANYTKWGRRKPYIIGFAPLLGISFIFLVLPTLFLNNPPKMLLFVWFLIWDGLFKISYSMTTVFQSWMAEQFPVGERPKVSQFQNYFNWIGNGLMAIVNLIVITGYVTILQVDGINTPIPTSFLIIVFSFGLLAIVSYLLAGFYMPTEPHFRIQTNLRANLGIVVRNRNYWKIILMIGIASLGWSIVVDALLSYSQHALFLTGFDFYIIAVFLLIGIFSFLYMWRKLLEKMGKKRSLLYIFLFAVVFLPMTSLVLIVAIPRLILGIIFIIGATGVLGGWFLFPYIIYADVAEDDEKRTGQLKAGIYTGFNSIFLNLFQAFGVFVLGTAISALPSIALMGKEVAWGLIVFGPISSFILLIALLYTNRYVKLDFEWEKNQELLK
jgi:Na+/melibiose symporter-like transporter